MTSNHIDQLAQWWENAERGTARKGDAVILRNEDGSYEVHPDAIEEDREYDHLRILARAPKPKPAWHDAVAVRARWEDPSGDESEPFDGVDTFVSSGDGWWIGGYDNARPAEELYDVTPLIEAKVTDEMVERYWAAMKNPGSNYDEAVRRALTAALGIETE